MLHAPQYRGLSWGNMAGKQHWGNTPRAQVEIERYHVGCRDGLSGWQASVPLVIARWLMGKPVLFHWPGWPDLRWPHLTLACHGNVQWQPWFVMLVNIQDRDPPTCQARWSPHLMWSMWVNALRPRQNRCHFTDDIFKWIFLNEMYEFQSKFH